MGWFRARVTDRVIGFSSGLQSSGLESGESIVTALEVYKALGLGL